jgi:hypothetical protein
MARTEMEVAEMPGALLWDRTVGRLHRIQLGLACGSIDEIDFARASRRR